MNWASIIKPLLDWATKIFGAWFLVKHGEQKAEKEQLEAANEILQDNAKIDSARLSDSDIERMR